MPLLETQNLTKRFGGGLLGGAEMVALDDFNLCLLTDEPAIVAIISMSPSMPSKGSLWRLMIWLRRKIWPTLSLLCWLI